MITLIFCIISDTARIHSRLLGRCRIYKEVAVASGGGYNSSGITCMPVVNLIAMKQGIYHK